MTPPTEALTASFAGLSHEFLSLKAKAQARDKHGRFIKMHSIVRWLDGDTGHYHWGSVNSIDNTGHIHVLQEHSANKGEVSLLPKQVEVVKALIPHDAADVKAYEPDKPVSHVNNVMAHLNHAGIAKHLVSPSEDLTPIAKHEDAKDPWGEPLYVDTAGFKKVGGQGGSNLGGTFEGPDGTQYYIKKAEDEQHVANEILAARLYQDAGINVPEVYATEWTDGSPAVASKIVPNMSPLYPGGKTSAETLAEGRKGFAMDAWLSNWDSIGLAYDNMMKDANGNAVRVDTGGALLYRAMGTPKGHLFGDHVGEVKTLRDSSMNPQAAKIFGGMTDAQVKQDIQNTVDKVDESKVNALIDELPFSSQKVKDDLKKTIQARKDDLHSQFGITAPKKPTEPTTPSADKAEPAKPASSAVDSMTSDQLVAKLEQLRAEAKTYSEQDSAVTLKAGKGGVLTPYDIYISTVAQKKLEELRKEAQPYADALWKLHKKDVAPLNDPAAEEWNNANGDPQFTQIGSLSQEAWDKLRDQYVVNDPMTLKKNQELRSGSPSPAAKSWATKMDKMVGQNKLSQDVTLYRGAALSPEHLATIQPGSMLEDKGFMSTGEMGDAAFYSEHRARSIPGSKIAIFTIHAHADQTASDVGYGEVVLPRDSKMLVKSVHESDGTNGEIKGAVYVTAELAPNGDLSKVKAHTADSVSKPSTEPKTPVSGLTKEEISKKFGPQMGDVNPDGTVVTLAIQLKNGDIVKLPDGTVAEVQAPYNSLSKMQLTGLTGPKAGEDLTHKSFKSTKYNLVPQDSQIYKDALAAKNAQPETPAAKEEITAPPSGGKPDIAVVFAKDIKAGDEFLSPAGSHFIALEDYSATDKGIKAQGVLSGKKLTVKATDLVTLKKVKKTEAPSAPAAAPAAPSYYTETNAAGFMQGDLVELNDGTIAQLQSDWSYITPLKGLTGPRAGEEIGAKWNAGDKLKLVGKDTPNGIEALSKAPKKEHYEDGPYHPPLVNQPKFSEEQHDALDEYTGDGYIAINNYLRGETPNDDGYWSQAALEEVVSQIDSAIAESVVQHEAITYRGVSKKVLVNPKPGQVITDTAYVSTSSDIGVAKSFAGGHNGTILEIHLPPGAHAVDTSKTPANSGEKEFLLPRNSQFLIKEVGVQSNGTKYVIADLLPKGPHGDAAKQAEEGVGNDSGGAPGGAPSTHDVGTGGHPGNGTPEEGAPGQVSFAVNEKVGSKSGWTGKITKYNPKTGQYLVQSDPGPSFWKHPDQLYKLEDNTPDQPANPEVSAVDKVNAAIVDLGKVLPLGGDEVPHEIDQTIQDMVNNPDAVTAKKLSEAHNWFDGYQSQLSQSQSDKVWSAWKNVESTFTGTDSASAMPDSPHDPATDEPPATGYEMAAAHLAHVLQDYGISENLDGTNPEALKSYLADYSQNVSDGNIPAGGDIGDAVKALANELGVEMPTNDKKMSEDATFVKSTELTVGDVVHYGGKDQTVMWHGSAGGGENMALLKPTDGSASGYVSFLDSANVPIVSKAEVVPSPSAPATGPVPVKDLKPGDHVTFGNDKKTVYTVDSTNPVFGSSNDWQVHLTDPTGKKTIMSHPSGSHVFTKVSGDTAPANDKGKVPAASLKPGDLFKEVDGKTYTVTSINTTKDGKTFVHGVGKNGVPSQHEFGFNAQVDKPDTPDEAGKVAKTPTEPATPDKPNGTLVSGSDHVYKDAKGEYVVTKNGHVLRVGDQVTSTKDGLTGTIVQLEKGPHYIKVKGPDGKIKGRQMNTLVPAKVAETDAPKFSPKKINDLKPGDKVKLPSGNVYTVKSVKDTTAGGVHVHVVNDETGKELDNFYGNGDTLDTHSVPINRPTLPQTPSDHVTAKGSELKTGDTLLNTIGEPLGVLSNPTPESGGSTKWTVELPSGAHVSTWTSDHINYKVIKAPKKNYTPEQQYEKGIITHAEYVAETGHPYEEGQFKPGDKITAKDMVPGMVVEAGDGTYKIDSVKSTNSGYYSLDLTNIETGQKYVSHTLNPSFNGWTLKELPDAAPAAEPAPAHPFKVGQKIDPKDIQPGMKIQHSTGSVFEVTSAKTKPNGDVSVGLTNVKTGSKLVTHIILGNSNAWTLHSLPDATQTPAESKTDLYGGLKPGDKVPAQNMKTGMVLKGGLSGNYFVVTGDPQPANAVGHIPVEMKNLNTNLTNIKNVTPSALFMVPSLEDQAKYAPQAHVTEEVHGSKLKPNDVIQIDGKKYTVVSKDNGLSAIVIKDATGTEHVIPQGKKYEKLADAPQTSTSNFKPGDKVKASNFENGMAVSDSDSTYTLGNVKKTSYGSIADYTDVVTGKTYHSVPTYDTGDAHTIVSLPGGQTPAQESKYKPGETVKSTDFVDGMVISDGTHYKLSNVHPTANGNISADFTVLKSGAVYPGIVTAPDETTYKFVSILEEDKPQSNKYKPGDPVAPADFVDGMVVSEFGNTEYKLSNVEKTAEGGYKAAFTKISNGTTFPNVYVDSTSKSFLFVSSPGEPESAATAAPAVLSGALAPGSEHVYKDAQGKYVINKHGWILREGMQVVSAKDGHAGTIKLLELKNKYAKVTGADGSVKGRQIDTLKPVDPNAQKVTPGTKPGAAVGVKPTTLAINDKVDWHNASTGEIKSGKVIASEPSAGNTKTHFILFAPDDGSQDKYLHVDKNNTSTFFVKGGAPTPGSPVNVPPPGDDVTPSGSSVNKPGGLVPEVASKGWIQAGNKTPKQFKPGDVVGNHKQLVVSAVPHPTNDKKTLVQFADQPAPLTLHNTTQWQKWEPTLPGVIGKKTANDFQPGDVVGTNEHDVKVVQKTSEWSDTPGSMDVLFKGDSEWHSIPEDASYYQFAAGTKPSPVAPKTPETPAGPVVLTHDPIDHAFPEGGTVSVPAGGAVYAGQYWSQKQPILTDAFGHAWRVDPATGDKTPINDSYSVKSLSSSDLLTENQNQADVTPNLDAVLGDQKQTMIAALEKAIKESSSHSWGYSANHKALLKLINDPSGDSLTDQEWQYAGVNQFVGGGAGLSPVQLNDVSIEIAKLQKQKTGTYEGEWRSSYPSGQYFFDGNQRKALGALGLSKSTQDFVTTKTAVPASNKEAAAEIHAAVTDPTNAQVVDDLFGHGTAAAIAASVRGNRFKSGLSGNNSPYAPKPPELPGAEGKNGTVFLGDNVVASDGQGGVVVLVTPEGKLRVRRSDGTHFTRKADSFTVTGSPVSSKKPISTATFTAKPRPEFQLADWSKPPIPGISTLPDALAKIKESEKAGNVGWAFPADGGQVEDLNVHINRVLDTQGQEMLELKFKLTPKQGDAMFKRHSADSENWTDKTIHVDSRQLPGPDKLAQLTGKYSYSGHGGRTFEKKSAGVTIQFHRANNKTMAQHGNNPVAFHNMVQIRMPADSSVADIQKAMYDAGVDKPAPSTSEDFLKLGESRLLALFASKTNAWIGNDNLSASSKQTLLDDIKSQWGITAKDLGVAHGANGRIEMRLPKEVVDKIRAKTKVNYTAHSLTSGHDSLTQVGQSPHGALLSTTIRRTEGVHASGMSSEPDIHSGGADYLFAYPRQSLAPLTGLVFDTSRLFQRMDFFTRAGDTYGTHGANMDIIAETKPTAHEIMFKHRLDLNDAIGYIVGSEYDRTSTIASLKAAGVTHFGSRTVEEFVILNPGGNATAPTPQVPITWLNNVAGGTA